MARAAAKVVVVGGGFGGLHAVRSLRRAPVEVILIDRNNHHLFQPLLYQVATAGLTAGHIAAPLRKIFRSQKNVSVHMAEVQEVDLANRRVLLSDASIPYDFLILATGASHTYFGHPEWESAAPGLKTVEDALECRRRVLSAFERAERETDSQRRAALLTFVVVGAGPTGVEMAGALSELARHTLAGEFRRFDPADSRVVLVEAGPNVLPGYPPDLSESAQRQLEALGVEVMTGFPVTRVDEYGVESHRRRLKARTVIWAAGVHAAGPVRDLDVPKDRAGRAEVCDDLSIPSHPEVFVIGDAAGMRTKTGEPVPGVAPAAIQAGRHAAHNIVATLRAKPRTPFVYRDRGALATIGRSSAVGWIKGWKLSGFWAWFAWLWVHVFFLITFRNRLVVLFEWAWGYVTYQRTARVVVQPASSATSPSESDSRMRAA